MSKLDSNEHRRKEGDVHKGLPEAAPDVHNPYEEDDLPVDAERQPEKPAEGKQAGIRQEDL